MSVCSSLHPTHPLWPCLLTATLRPLTRSSQAVYRYLAVMYGFNPRNTPDGDPTPSRIGDIM